MWDFTDELGMNWECGLDSPGLIRVQMLASMMHSLIPYNK